MFNAKCSMVNELMKTDDIGIVILAAGASTRFGSPKQLAEFEGKTLIEKVTDTAVSTGFETVVVLGANSGEISDLIKDRDVEIVINKHWKSGLSSSIRAGLTTILELTPGLSAVMLLLADQPKVSKRVLMRLVERHLKSEKPIAACEYAGTVGTPALFRSAMFSELLELRGDAGAKKLIEAGMENEVAVIDWSEGADDVDTRSELDSINGP